MAVSQRKAKKILEDGEVRGEELTEDQKDFFGAIAGGANVDSPPSDIDQFSPRPRATNRETPADTFDPTPESGRGQETAGPPPAKNNPSVAGGPPGDAESFDPTNNFTDNSTAQSENRGEQLSGSDNRPSDVDTDYDVTP